MNITDSLNASATARASQPAAKKTELGKEDFLRLLTTQLSQQDPLSPMDNQAFVAQLSQLATVEQLQNMTSGMQNMALAQSANTSAQVVSFIGQDVRVSSDVLDVKDSKVDHPAGFRLESDADSVEITVKDENGKVVDTIELGARDKGDNAFEWDGKDKDGNPVPSGKYTFTVSATKGDDEPVGASEYTERRVRGITYSDGFPRLMFDGNATASLGEVVEVVSR
ncbi:MAG: flagellar hook assembly protein FlgD [bacterium]